MQVNVTRLGALFSGPVRYVIPSFQRPYVWNRTDQWKPLWEDVRDVAERCLADAASRAHFLGAVVLQQEATPVTRPQKRLIVDGQQRLTTLQLLLDAVQEVYQNEELHDPATRLGDLVRNPRAKWDGDSDRRFKVWPTRLDQPAFRAAMANDQDTMGHEESLLVECHQYFREQAREWLRESKKGDARKARAEALETALAQKLELVVIDLDEGDNPHVIFETLNARGTPLRQSDLVKNMIMYEAERSGSTDDDDDLWRFNDRWWNEEVRQGRLYRARIDMFLNYWLVFRKRRDVQARDVFSVFREYHDRSDRRVEEIAEDIAAASHIFRDIEESGSGGQGREWMEDFIDRWKTMQAGVLTPAVLWLLSHDVPPEQLRRAVQALESHQVRRMICRRTTMGANKLFIELLRRLERTGPAQAGDTTVGFLLDQESNVGEWPTDTAMRDAMLTLRLYKLLSQRRLRMVLEAIETKMRVLGSETDVIAPLPIEHIMPQSWGAHWPIADTTDPEAVEHRNRVLHTIGNLTLTSWKLGLTLSNKPWPEKRSEIEAHSGLFLNKDILKSTPPPTPWDESAIEARGKRLCEIACRIWPRDALVSG